MNDDVDYIMGATLRIENLIGTDLPVLTKMFINNIIQQAIWRGIDRERARTREWLDDAGTTGAATTNFTFDDLRSDDEKVPKN